jgi:hypothetical protein
MGRAARAALLQWLPLPEPHGFPLLLLLLLLPPMAVAVAPALV